MKLADVKLHKNKSGTGTHKLQEYAFCNCITGWDFSKNDFSLHPLIHSSFDFVIGLNRHFVFSNVQAHLVRLQSRRNYWARGIKVDAIATGANGYGSALYLLLYSLRRSNVLHEGFGVGNGRFHHKANHLWQARLTIKENSVTLSFYSILNIKYFIQYISNSRGFGVLGILNKPVSLFIIFTYVQGRWRTSRFDQVTM